MPLSDYHFISDTHSLACVSFGKNSDDSLKIIDQCNNTTWYYNDLAINDDYTYKNNSLTSIKINSNSSKFCIGGDNPNYGLLNFEAEDSWTLEFLIFFNSLTTDWYARLCLWRSIATTDTNYGGPIDITFVGTQRIVSVVNTGIVTPNQHFIDVDNLNMQSLKLHHIAFVKNAYIGKVSLFVNGIKVGDLDWTERNPAEDPPSQNNGPGIKAARNPRTSYYPIDCYVTSFHISDVCRYDESFTYEPLDLTNPYIPSKDTYNILKIY